VPVSRVEVGGTTLHLLPQKALWWPEQRTLLVADAHIGKAVSFRRLGVPVPRGTTSATLDLLGQLVEQHGAARVVFLGDLLHSPRAHAAGTLHAFAQWRSRHAGLDLVLVRGNHDDRAGDPPAALGVQCVDEPYALPAAAGLALCHYPHTRAGAYVLAGHAHPCTHVGRGIDRLRLPCFHFGATVGVLPAFGAFTGMHPIERVAGDRVFVVADNAVHALPPQPAFAR
jgi:DNA ligase-associated metallophosphoesterase